MLVAEEYIRDVVQVCSREMDRKNLVLAIAGKDCTIMLVSGCWENLGFKVNSVCFAPKVWLRVGLFLCDEGEGQDAGAGWLCGALGKCSCTVCCPHPLHLLRQGV